MAVINWGLAALALMAALHVSGVWEAPLVFIVWAGAIALVEEMRRIEKAITEVRNGRLAEGHA